MNPLVSIIIPAYNAGKYIEEAINSALNQTYSLIEIIVIDDGSEDNTLEVIKIFDGKISLIKNSHQGASSARNSGIKSAKGELIAFLDADDTINKDKISLQVAEFKADPSLDLCYTMFSNFLTPDADENLKKTKPEKEGPIKGCVCGTTMVKKSSFEKVGYFDSNLTVGEFIGWYSKAMNLNFKVKFIELDLYSRRIHKNNSSLVNRSKFSDLTKVLFNKLKSKDNS